MIPKISAAEWEVMNVVWASPPPVTSATVYEALSEEQEWKQKTINTFLTRLAEKKVLTVTKLGNTNLYTPRLRREQCVAAEGDSFLNKVFQGAAGSLMLHFCEKADLSADEIKHLEQILKSKKGAK
ncbi:MAG TPA: BlaI/MecI/CopY family transcriptional regulator [Lacunisphaera sp.]